MAGRCERPCTQSATVYTRIYSDTLLTSTLRADARMQWWQRASLNGWIKQKRLVGANIKASIFIFVRRKNDITSKAKLILNQL